MTINLFLVLFTVGALIASLLTQALKKLKEDVPANILAFIDAFVVGVAGMVIYYIIEGIPFTAANIAYIVLMAFCIFLSSTVGYDKCMQTIEQIRRL